MDVAERHSAVQKLGQEMSDISEDCYCAGWLGGTEYFVPELCRRAIRAGRPFYWGHGSVTPERARELVELAKQAGSWADLDEPGVGFVPFQPFPIPVEYVDAIEREQSSRYAQSQGGGQAAQELSLTDLPNPQSLDPSKRQARPRRVARPPVGPWPRTTPRGAAGGQPLREAAGRRLGPFWKSQ